MRERMSEESKGGPRGLYALGGTFVSGHTRRSHRRLTEPGRDKNEDIATMESYIPDAVEARERLTRNDKLHRFVPIDDVTDEMARAAW